MVERGIAVVVEDDDDIRTSLTEVLLQSGFAVHATASGLEGVEAVREHNPVIVTMDVGLPDFDGIEASRRIRTFSDAYLIIVTGRVDEADALMGFEAGADDYLTKPFNPRELVARVRAVLRRAETRSSSAPATVFVSSVIEDYAAERQAVRDAIYTLQNEGLDVRPVLAEELPAGREAPRTALLEEVGSCDVYVGILGRRYGYVNPHSGLSATEEEYRRAREHAKPILLFVEQLPAGEEGEARQREFVGAVTDYVSGHYVSFFQTLDQLRLQAYRALAEQMRGRRT